MHILDFLSDLYVVLLWSRGGKPTYVAAGCLFIGVAALLTSKVCYNWLERRRKELPDTYHISPNWSLLLLPLNMPTLPWIFLVLRDRSDRDAWESFAVTKILHSSIEAVPLSIMVGVELLAADGDTLGKEVKWTSLALSVFGYVFAGIVQSTTVHQMALEEMFDAFFMAFANVSWMVVAVGWTAALPAHLYPGLAIGAAYVVIAVGTYRVFHDLYDPANEDAPELLSSALNMFLGTFGMRPTLPEEIMRRKRDFVWVSHVMSAVFTIAPGGTNFICDLRYGMPAPGASVVRKRPRREQQQAVLRRFVLAALCIFHLSARFSFLRLGVVLGCATGDVFFTLCARGLFPGYGFFALLSCICTLMGTVFWLPITAFHAALQASNRLHTSGVGATALKAFSIDVQSLAAVGVATIVLRPPGVQLSDEELEFYDSMEDVHAATRRSSEAGHVDTQAAADQLAAIEASANFVTRSILEQTYSSPIMLSAVLKKHFRPLCTDEERRICAAALKLEVANQAESAAQMRPLSARGDNEDGYTVYTGINTVAKQPTAKQLRKKAHSELLAAENSVPAADDLKLMLPDRSELPAAPFHNIKFETVAATSLWAQATADVASYILSQPAEAADYFISHCWADPPGNKAALLRTFLFMQQFMAITVCSGILLALTFVPGGFILAELDRRVPWWAPSVAITAATVALIVWVTAWHATGTSGSYGPWRWSRLTFWCVRRWCALPPRSKRAEQPRTA